MIAVLSPSKTLDDSGAYAIQEPSTPAFLEESRVLVDILRRFSPADLAALMKISDRLAELNVQRFAAWRHDFTPQNAIPAIRAFKGDVYTGLAADTFSAADLSFAQGHLRILSGLYGLLRPLDLIQPYRLEMGTRLVTGRGKTLYAFWGEQITQALNRALRRHRRKTLVNLASAEYFKAVCVKKLDARVVTPVFLDFRNGAFKVISFYAKKARGRMAAFMVRRRLAAPDGLKSFTGDGYRFDAGRSTDERWVFTRQKSPTDGKTA